MRLKVVPISQRVASALAACLIVAGAVVSLAANRAKPDTSADRKGGLPKAVTAAPNRPAMDVAPVDARRRDKVRAQAAAIDAILATRWQEYGVVPSPSLDDAQFVRRIHLELAGRIPTYDETVAFLQNDSSDKRDALIERLLASPDYVSHFYNFWADILRLTERPQRNLIFEPYLAYVKDSIRTNKRYDDWVREMLTADGRLWENPAVGFQLRDDGMPLPYVDNTVRVLLGTQIGCAQCHDHPFDRWTQHEFYELAAFTAGTKMRLGAAMRPGKPGKEAKPVPPPAVRALVKEAKESRGRKAAQLIQFIQANATGVSFQDRPLRLPHDYQYDDAKPLEPVTKKLLWGSVPASVKNADGREQFASWMVARTNRQFARTIANRMWKKVMGVGLVEPDDDFRKENPPSDPELLEHLTDLVLRLDFDLREFVRAVVSTSAYQRRAVIHDPTAAEPFRFTGPALRRMTAEQLWDSIVTLVARNPWSVQRPAAAEIAEVASVDLRQASLDDVERQFDAFFDRYGPGRYQRMLQQNCGYRGQWLMKASEMPTPLPLGHFLRQFGQSDRETIEGGRTVPTIPQILAMFNGPITHAMLEKGSVIYETVMSHDPEETVDVIFLSVLSHEPAADDRREARDEIASAADPATGCGNLIWALLNTREFIFIQ
ncbi:MAG: DUF1549 and DUF1553 domain-containing protein [Planctomycetia bacterium]|nr:DUF1549 and DUF1553 domain-containing protein [Planctomycetia bacterium]